MKKKCNQCQSEMLEDCYVTVQGGMYGIKIRKKGKGLFNRVSAIPKAAVCPNCGNVHFYIDEFKEFIK
ncbi:nucleic acid-binding protein [Neobacillus drentensis]|uniref:nucleic acid-binding protein n=1 Tax=Neobacillus drentensis TaxID=220684 RepID=UPI00286A21FC|nr:nucleic acid-binding protein [Neobacillus drentensis]